MKAHFISKIHVERLWGNEKPISFPLHEDVNIIIGPNASGKTTIINLLMYALTGNVIRLIDYHFDSITITLRSFESKHELILKVTKNKDVVRYEIAGKTFQFPLLPGTVRVRHAGFADIPPEFLRRQFGAEFFELKRHVEGLVPAAWLPVSRRIPISEDEDEERRRARRGTLESVDECLADLLEGLQRYRVSLDAKLAELRKEFQKHALENILYDKHHDSIFDARALKAPTQEDKQQLLRAFQDVGFVDQAMENRVAEHFQAAQQAVETLRRNPTNITNQTIFIIPLIHRTKQMVEFAQHLEIERQKLFSSLTLFETTIKSFFEGKNVTVSPRGELDIKKDGNSQNSLTWKHLSSGEKQLLILLTQALLWDKRPVVYVADEPELSLHVTWQEKLLKSITSLAGQCQVIVATHSPDIAGGYHKNIIDLGKL